ncbi:MAG TPA: sigma 54-interacting transcriptional regulator [Polyangia bacterium]|nr:sigma 54-interacting transcriptional regulator [Polyangia bacterium]
MSSGAGTTTITQAVAGPSSTGTQNLSIAWRFPHSSAPPIALRRASGEEITIGRDPGCSAQLSGPDVSRRHAVVRPGPGALTTIADVGSRNGIRVNGRQTTQAQLGDQDVVRVGGWLGVVTAAPDDVAEIAPGFWGGGTLIEALAPVRQIAPTDLPIIVEGETGTGKERVAEALHRWSGRKGPFLAVNCAALPEALAEAELFGYRRGAFTGADRASPGFFRSAEQGTLLLDEVSDLPLGVQAKLLRVLEEREVQPLGEARPVAVDVRVVVAGQQPLMESVRAGRFRGDLLARLDGLTVRLPPLRCRREDVLPLFSRLLDVASAGRVPATDTDVAERLCVYDWPFNVRELGLLARRLVAVHGPGATLRLSHLPTSMLEAGSAPAVTVPQAGADPIQLPALVAALRAAGGNVARAAAVLGISRQRAYRLMEGQGVDLETIRGERDRPR